LSPVANFPDGGFVVTMTALLLFAPLFLLFEVSQLVLSERYLGIKQIARGVDPRTLGPGETAAFFWSMTIVGYWLWMFARFMIPFARVHTLALLGIAFFGFLLRRGCGLKWVLVILTFEGAVRIGLLFSLTVMAWRRF
jgi:hypothetical protein